MSNQTIIKYILSFLLKKCHSLELSAYTLPYLYLYFDFDHVPLFPTLPLRLSCAPIPSN